MTNHSKNNGILPPNGDNSPNTRESSEYSPHYFRNITKALFPYSSKGDAVETTLNDNHGFLLDSLISQTELLRDLGGKTQGNEDIDGHGLAGVADSLIRQLDILAVIQSEYHTQVTARNTKQKNKIAELARVKQDLDAMMRLIDTLKAENRALKGGAK